MSTLIKEHADELEKLREEHASDISFHMEAAAELQQEIREGESKLQTAKDDINKKCAAIAQLEEIIAGRDEEILAKQRVIDAADDRIEAVNLAKQKIIDKMNAMRDDIRLVRVAGALHLPARWLLITPVKNSAHE